MASTADVVRAARERLTECGIDAPGLSAQALLAFVTGRTRTQLWGHPEQEVSEDEVVVLRHLVERRCSHEPLAYLLGEREFFGRPFWVNGSTLIPRPESEGLIERALAWVDRRRAYQSTRFLDVGTGSGTLATTLLAERSSLRGIATDIQHGALVVARRNAARHGVADHLILVQTSLDAGLRCHVDLLVANLPYIPTDDIDRLTPDVVEFEPRLALDGGPDGTELISTMVGQLKDVLAPGGLALFEIGFDQGARLLEAAQSQCPGAEVTVEPDAAGLDRFLQVQLSA